MIAGVHSTKESAVYAVYDVKYRMSAFLRGKVSYECFSDKKWQFFNRSIRKKRENYGTF